MSLSPENPALTPPPLAQITLAGGCFWCLEAVYLRVAGVRSVQSGYANGHLDDPSYEAVCTGSTGHAEVVQLRYDPARVSLDDLLAIFFVIHDPTTLNRQGHDEGTQYRSGIYWHDPAQRSAIDQAMALANEATGGAVVTEVAPLGCFWPAEAMHDRYFERHPHQGYCAHVIAPKVAKFQQRFAALVRPAGPPAA